MSSLQFLKKTIELIEQEYDPKDPIAPLIERSKQWNKELLNEALEFTRERLGSDRQIARQKAKKLLIEIGRKYAGPVVNEGLTHKDLEVRESCKEIIKAWDDASLWNQVKKIFKKLFNSK